MNNNILHKDTYIGFTEEDILSYIKENTLYLDDGVTIAIAPTHDLAILALTEKYNV